ncbi:hypothetical protein KUCAC02_020540, partial [Chaenocephalus aceratus]
SRGSPVCPARAELLPPGTAGSLSPLCSPEPEQQLRGQRPVCVPVSEWEPGALRRSERDFTYLIVVLIGLGVTGGLLYVVFQELFSTSSPNKVYGKAFNIIRLDPGVVGAFGEPVKCYGETTRRGGGSNHHEFLKDGVKHMRLKFYVEGSEPGRKGTVHTESRENPKTGKYEFRYIIVEMDTYPRRTIIVEDNR